MGWGASWAGTGLHGVVTLQRLTEPNASFWFVCFSKCEFYFDQSLPKKITQKKESRPSLQPLTLLRTHFIFLEYL